MEIDLVIERPGRDILLIEIKSTTQVTNVMLKNLISISRDIPNSRLLCLSNDPFIRQVENVMIYPWKIGLKEIFLNQEF
jgi:hypothetical protein